MTHVRPMQAIRDAESIMADCEGGPVGPSTIDHHPLHGRFIGRLAGTRQRGYRSRHFADQEAQMQPGPPWTNSLAIPIPALRGTPRYCRPKPGRKNRVAALKCKSWLSAEVEPIKRHCRAGAPKPHCRDFQRRDRTTQRIRCQSACTSRSGKIPQQPSGRSEQNKGIRTLMGPIIGSRTVEPVPGNASWERTPRKSDVRHSRHHPRVGI